jgi:hypothetical protein
MERLIKIEEIVEKILNIREDARENDDILYLYVCEYFNRGVSSMSLKDFLTTRKVTGCPDVASVKRSRRKVFERRPELKPPKITELREEMVDVYVDYAINR